METIVTEVVSDQSLRDARGRRITSEERRAELLAEYKTSGMTPKAFAKRAGINFHTFVSWLADERRSEPGTSQNGRPVPFVELGAPARPMPLMPLFEVVLRDGRIVRGADAVALVGLIRRLGQ